MTWTILNTGEGFEARLEVPPLLYVGFGATPAEAVLNGERLIDAGGPA